jgi:ERCC4-type nuclease
MISIFVDYRERNHEIVSFLRKCAGVTVQFAKLEVGDYLLHNLLVERKTLVDFCESIKSGRIFSQATQLARSKIQTLIIIEIMPGELSRSKLRLEAIQGAIITLSVIYNLPVLRSRSPEDTARLLLFASRQIENLGTKNKWLRRPPPPKSFLSDKRKMQLHLLQGFPGIGPIRAKKLLEQFRSIKDLLNSDEEKIIRLTQFDRQLVRQIIDLAN